METLSNVPQFMEWTGDWGTESRRVGEEFSLGKTFLEKSMARLYLIWKTNCWRDARHKEIDGDTGEILHDDLEFDKFEEVIRWFDENWGVARSTAFERIQLYERLHQIGVPLEVSMAAMSQLKLATKDLIEMAFVFEPRTHQLLSTNNDVGALALPELQGVDSPGLNEAKDAVTQFLTGHVGSINEGEESREEVAALIRHEVLRKPNIFLYTRDNGDIEIAWQFPEGGVEDGSVLMPTSLLPLTIRSTIWNRMGIRS